MADNISLFGPSPQDAAQMLQQQQQKEAMQFASQMGPQGNPFYVPGIAATMGRGAAGLGQGIGQLFGVHPPEIEKAYKMQAIQEAVEAKGIDIAEDPVGYAKVAASEMLKGGMRQEALQAIQWAQKMQSDMADIDYKGALGQQARAVATEKIDLLDEKAADMKARTELTQAKTTLEKIKGELKWAEEARAAAREPKEIELLDARIAKLKADAATAGERAKASVGRMSRENMNQMLARMLQEEMASGNMTREEALEILKAGAVDPLRMIMGQLGGQMGGQPTPAPNPKFTQPPAAQGTVPVEKPYPAQPGKGPYKPEPGYDYKKAATKAFGKYEPEKYDYRVNPETGKIQRKAK